MGRIQQRTDGRVEQAEEQAERARGQEALNEPPVGDPENDPRIDRDHEPSDGPESVED